MAWPAQAILFMKTSSAWLLTSLARPLNNRTGAVKGADNVHINLEPDQDDITKLDAFAKQLVEKAAQD